MTTKTLIRNSKPILFSSEMVRALMDGRKTQTRRVIKDKDGNQPTEFTEDGWPLAYFDDADEIDLQICPYGKPGESVLWVRETWFSPPWPHNDFLGFFADDDYPHGKAYRMRPSIHMPRRVSRLTLKITDIRVERVQDITEDDALAEGCVSVPWGAWWQGYRKDEWTGELYHQDIRGDTPPDWMIEPKRCANRPDLDRSAKIEYECLWNSLNAKRGYSWDSNPYVWVIEFEVIKKNIDRYLEQAYDE